MNTYVLVQQSAVFIPQWERLFNFSKHKIILITCTQIYDLMDISIISYFMDIHLVGDFNFEKLKEVIEKNILSKINKENITDIITNCEYPLVTCARLRDYFGFKGDSVNTVLPFRDKLIMKEKLKGLSCLPRYLPFDKSKYNSNKKAYLNMLENTIHFPMFVKPIDDAASRGTAKILSQEEIQNWEKSAMPNIKYEFDEYIDGTLFHCDSIIKDGKILFEQISKYYAPCSKFLQGIMLGSIVLTEDDEDTLRIKEFNKLILHKFKYLPNGTTHMEVFKTADNKLMFLEIAARPPGVLVGQMYEKYLRLDYKTVHYQLQMDMDISFICELNGINNNAIYAAWCVFPKKQGIVKSMRLPEKIRSKFLFEPNVKIEEKMNGATNLLDISCSFLLWNDDYQQLYRDFYQLGKYDPIEILEVN